MPDIVDPLTTWSRLNFRFLIDTEHSVSSSIVGPRLCSLWANTNIKFKRGETPG